ncbi:Aste57867_9090 [Aphanomyces stellatus]|uniref:Aste57867_9090 protein n=1 Tax=Aphanomyces stellatus TaxID=120398 RepID=A0A485KLX2_9STRA|nr:hypothetical protein As57867_009054 [Aphanomyces stellatus]VFT85974.1 Aste57867_9090 [Aphanomyces stellatus]
MRNIMIRKKLAERKRFDSADYAMQSTGAAPPDVGVALPTTKTHDKSAGNDDPRTSLHIATTDLDGVTTTTPARRAVASPVHSPVQIGMAAFFDSMEDTNMENTPNPPSVESMTLSPANRQTTVASDAKSKYGALSARNIILRRKLAQRTKFDSADYQLKKYGQGTEMEDVEMSADEVVLSPPTSTAAPKINDEALPVPLAAAEPVPTPVAAPAAPQTNYGKLCAQNILIRKKLKERKRFDSADYSMEHSGAAKGNTDAIPTPSPMVAAQSVVVTSAAATHGGAFRPALTSIDQHQPKHLKLSVASPKPQGASSNGVTKEGSMRDVNSPTSRVAARNILLQRRLEERKRFDSADHFLEQQQHHHH